MGIKKNERKRGKAIPKGPRMNESKQRKAAKKQTTRGMRKKKK